MYKFWHRIGDLGFMKAVFLKCCGAGLVVLFFSGCVQDTRVDVLITQIEQHKQEISELKEQVKILSAATQEQAALRVLLEETRRQLAALEVARGAAQAQPQVVEPMLRPRPFGVDINQGDTRAQIIEVTPR